MLFQETGIPDNLSFLLLGIAILLSIVGGWVASYFWRLRNLQRDITLLAEMAEEDGASARAAELVEADPDNSNAPSVQPT